MDTPSTPGVSLHGSRPKGSRLRRPGALHSGRLTLGRRAAAAGDFDIAVFALVRAANEHREDHQPLSEVFVLIELAAIYHHQNLLDRLPTLARRARSVLARSSISPVQADIVRLAVELIESGPEDLAGLEIFADCWARGEAQEARS